jgi:hypothetical protein
MYARCASTILKARMALLVWFDDWTILHELLIVWLVIVQPPLAVYWLLCERRPDADDRAD